MDKARDKGALKMTAPPAEDEGEDDDDLEAKADDAEENPLAMPPSQASAKPKLPILAHRKAILSAVRKHSVVIVRADTGSGKTTQLPQILLDEENPESFNLDSSERMSIAVTQPRRVAAVAVARRVAWERNCEVGDQVGYSVRFEERVSERTRIKYMTDGVLLREATMSAESLLRRYSVIIVDEAHERSSATDISIGLLKRVLAQAQRTGYENFRIIITSATLESHKFKKFFPDAGVIDIPGRTYPVETFYAEKTPRNKIAAAVQTAVEIHRRQPQGDILIFLTGQEEIDRAVRSLEEAISELAEGDAGPIVVLPLYASMPPELQARVFMPAPPDCRRCIIATNIADSGLVKRKHYDPTTGISALSPVQISQSQAAQRAGRAGRTQPGQVYRLYSSNDFNSLEVSTPAELLNQPLASAVLQIRKALPRKVPISEFEFIDHPGNVSIDQALKELYAIDAIDTMGQLTDIGKQLIILPLEPAQGRVLLEAIKMNCVSQALTVISMLSVDNVFDTHKKEKEDESGIFDDRKQLYIRLARGEGDVILMLRLYESAASKNFRPKTVRDLGLQPRSMTFVKDVRQQLMEIMQKEISSLSRVKNPGRWEVFGHSSVDTEALRKCLCTGFPGRVAVRALGHNGYRTAAESSTFVEVSQFGSQLLAASDGLLPKALLYHEIVITVRPCLKKCTVVSLEWIKPYLEKIREASTALKCLSAQSRPAEEGGAAQKKAPEVQQSQGVQEDAAKSSSKADEARKRYLERKRLRG